MREALCDKGCAGWIWIDEQKPHGGQTLARDTATTDASMVDLLISTHVCTKMRRYLRNRASVLRDFGRRIVAMAPRLRAGTAFCASAIGAAPRFGVGAINMNRVHRCGSASSANREATKLRPGRRQPAQPEIRTMASCGSDEGRRDPFARVRQRNRRMITNRTFAVRRLACSLIAGMALQAGGLANAQKQSADPFDAVAKGSPILELRPRSEYVEQGGRPNDGEATTLRTRLGWQTTKWNGLQALIEIEDVHRIGPENYDTSLNGRTSYGQDLRSRHNGAEPPAAGVVA
jgi:hypothetical protein